MKISELNDRFLHVEGVKTLFDVAYGGDDRQKLDIYWPAHHTLKSPCILFAHGGAMIKGDKRRYHLKGPLQALEMGYIVVSINYRLAPRAVYPAQYNDVDAAYRFIQAHATDYGIDTEKLVAWGESAGALLSMVCALKKSDMFVDLTINPYPSVYKINTIVDQYGPTDLLEELAANPSKRRIRELQFGLKGSDLDRALETVSSTNLLDSSAPNIVILHGEADQVVDVKQAKLLKFKYNELGLENKSILHTFVGLDHDSDSLFLHVNKALDALDMFVK